MDLKNRESAPMIQMFLEKKIMLAPSTITDRPLPDAPSTKTEEIETKRSTTSLPDSYILEEGSAHSPGENHPAPAASLTPFQIRSIPTMAAPKTGRKHQRQESEMLTSTSVKAEQALKFKKPNIKKTKISELEGSRKTKTKRSSV
ncbi:unnamed protein product, partial [Brenthis ino]